jgi:hypothetical protein
MDARRSPGPVFGDHAKDQLSDLLRQSPLADWPSQPGNQPGVQTETGPAPSDDCLRRDDNQRVLPRGPNSPRRQPRQFIESS